MAGIEERLASIGRRELSETASGPASERFILGPQGFQEDGQRLWITCLGEQFEQPASKPVVPFISVFGHQPLDEFGYVREERVKAVLLEMRIVSAHHAHASVEAREARTRHVMKVEDAASPE